MKKINEAQKIDDFVEANKEKLEKAFDIIYPQTLDDEFPDAFNGWIGNATLLELENIIKQI